MSNNDITLKVDNGQFIYRVAAIILYDDKILMNKHIDYNCYYTVGGKVRFGESTEQAVIREVKEETQHDYEIDQLAFIQERFFHFKDIAQHEVIFYYYMKENEVTNYLNGKYTDQGTDESMYLLDIQSLKDKNIVPEFFKTLDIKKRAGIQHIISIEN